MTISEELLAPLFEAKCKKAVDSLCRHNFNATFYQTAKEASAHILTEASKADTIGCGGSVSLTQIGIIKKLEKLAKVLLPTDHRFADMRPAERSAYIRRQLTCDLFITGTNALTLTGSLVNIDATGNRCAAMFVGPKKVIVVAGRNKLVTGVDEAVARIKTYAAPANARRLGYMTPCAETGFCTDCNSPHRICNILTVIDRKPRLTDIHVLVVNENLGL